MTPVERLNAAFVEISRLIDTVGILQRHRRESLAMVSQLEVERVGLQAKHEELQAKHEELQAKHEELQANYDEALIELKQAQELCLSLDEAASELRVILASRSWRLTKPFRVIWRYLITKPYCRITVWLGRN